MFGWNEYNISFSKLEPYTKIHVHLSLRKMIVQYILIQFHFINKNLD